MSTPHYIIGEAQANDAPRIASLMMEAMNHECCQWFAGPNHTLDDFHQLLTRLIGERHSQYSYLNTLVVRLGNEVVGIATSYDGGELHTLRKAFIEGALEAFGQDHSNIPDETQAGELYLDTLCVDAAHRGQGLAKQLLHATIEKGRKINLPTGLLVDEGNPRAERLYKSVGFVYQNDNSWGGHKQHHLVHPLLP